MASYCGCLWYEKNASVPTYLPQVSLKAHATILSSTARTTLTQTFLNPSENSIKEISYQFPLEDGVSVVGFECKVGSRLLHSVVKTKSQANTDYQNAVAQRQTAAIMDHTSQNDIFIIRLGNVPAHEKINVDITFVGELKQDSQTDGIRYTLPSSIAPRYGREMSYHSDQLPSFGLSSGVRGMSITVDVQMEKGLVLRELESPSHRVKVSLGRISSTPATSSTFEPGQASASVIQEANNHSVFLGQDFVILIKVDGLDAPSALLETHPRIPNQRALMATLVPKFSLRPASPEVIFVIDRSGSMANKILALQSALRVFLKSLPVGVCFNICSFGSTHSFMWPKSMVYNSYSLQQALHYVETVFANMGGTEMEQAVIAAVGSRRNDRDLEVLILTDGQIYDQQSLFDFVREKAADNTARFFSLGIGNQASHSLIEGIARAGNGFCQSAMENEQLDRKVMGMLKGALTPHVYDYKLEVEYDTEKDDDFDTLSDLETPAKSDTETKVKDSDGDVAMEHNTGPTQKPISLFDANFQEPDINSEAERRATSELPFLTMPKAVQAPHKIPSLYPFIRTNVFLLMDPHSAENTPKALNLSATSSQGPLQLRIPITDIGTGETIHQLASRKAMIELEEEHGWLSDAKDQNGKFFETFDIEAQQRLAERECQALGIKFQITGKYCSFVALEKPTSLHSGSNDKQPASKEYAVEHVSYPQNESGSGMIYSPNPQCALFQSSPFNFQMGNSAQPQCHIRRASLAHSGTTNFGGFGASHLPFTHGTFAQGAARNQAQHAPLFGQMAMTTLPVESTPQFGRSPFANRGTPVSQIPVAYSSVASPAPPNIGGLFGGVAGASGGHDNPFTKASAATIPSMAPQMRVYEIIQLQTFDGSWMWSNALFRGMQLDVDATVNRLATMFAEAGRTIENGFPRGDEATVIATLLTMGWLENRNSDTRGFWELVYDKAEHWVTLKLEEMREQGSAGAIIESHREEITDMIAVTE